MPERSDLSRCILDLPNRGFLVADCQETETGREAKFYRLTREGRAQLQTEAASWRRK